MKVLLVVLCATALAIGVKAGYHREVGILRAARIKEAEDRIFGVGLNVKSAKIVGGTVAPFHAHPYLAGLIIYLQSGNMSECGASLVSPIHLLTAAHCWVDTEEPAVFVRVVLGSQYLNYGGVRINTNKVAAHPQYDENTLANDIAIIYLPSAITFTVNIQPVYLPASWDQAEQIGEWALAAGYGAMNDDKTNKSQIRQAYLQLVPPDLCMDDENADISQAIICTDGSGNVGTCQGDSGGPLVVLRNGRKILIGITSFGSDACEVGRPSGFTRITSHFQFLSQHIKFNLVSEPLLLAY